MKLSQKTILVTGGNSGIGLNLVKQLHALDNTIIVVSRSQNNWPQLTQFQPAVLMMQCDVSKKDDVVHLVKILKADKIPIDVVINSAGIQFTPKIIDNDFNFDGIENEIATNFTSIVWLSYLLLPILLSRPKSAIVNLSSGLAFFPKSGSAVYCATKAAMHSFSQSLRYQLTSTSVQVTEILLPLVDTPMTEGRGSGKISPAFAAQAIIKGIQQRKDEVYVGKSKLLPIMMRVWPGLVKRILSKY